MNIEEKNIYSKILSEYYASKKNNNSFNTNLNGNKQLKPAFYFIL